MRWPTINPAYVIMDGTSMMACEHLLRETLILPLDLAQRFGIGMKKDIICTALLPYGHDFTRGKRFYQMSQ
jgi:hypothetical protein